jgi:hypothetical protein
MGDVPVPGYKSCHGFMHILLQPCSILQYKKTQPLLIVLGISNKIHWLAGTRKAIPKGVVGEGHPRRIGVWMKSRGIGLPDESSRKPAVWRRNMPCSLSWILARAGECRLHPPSMAQWGQRECGTEARGRERLKRWRWWYIGGGETRDPDGYSFGVS